MVSPTLSMASKEISTEISVAMPVTGGPATTEHDTRCNTGPFSIHLVTNVSLSGNRCRANSEHTRESRPDYGLDFQVEVPQTFQGVRSSLASGLSRDAAV